MILKKENCKIPIEFNKFNNSYTIYSYQRITINPQEKKNFYLPYYRNFSNDFKYFNFELSKQLIEKGLLCLNININEESAGKDIILLLKNDSWINNEEINALSRIIGSAKKIDILPNTVLGKIFV